MSLQTEENKTKPSAKGEWVSLSASTNTQAGAEKHPITAGRPSQSHGGVICWEKRATGEGRRVWRQRNVGPSKAGTVALGHRCWEGLRKSLWVTARGAFASGRGGWLGTLESAGPQAGPQGAARSEGRHAGSAHAEPTGFSRNRLEQGALGILHGDGRGPGNLKQSNSNHHSALFNQKCLGTKKGPPWRGGTIYQTGSVQNTGWYRWAQVSGNTNTSVM